MKAVKEGIVNAYETRTGLSRTRLSKMMTDETWMDAQRAVDLGFADEILRGEPKSIPIPENAAIVNVLHNFRNLPGPLQALLTPKAEPVIQPPESSGNQQAADRLRAEARLLKKTALYKKE